LLRLAITGRRLFILGKSDSEDCTECETQEDIQHLYWSCPTTRRLWERLKQIVTSKLGICLPLSEERCLIGTGNWVENKHKEEVQLLNIWTKYYIHLNKCNNTKRTEKGLEIYIRGNLKTEREIAKRNGKINLFQDKWNDLAYW